MDSPNSEISDANEDIDISDPEDDVEDEEFDFHVGGDIRKQSR